MHWKVHCMCTGICTGASAIPNVLFGMAQPPNSGPAIPTGDPTLTSKRRLKKKSCLEWPNPPVRQGPICPRPLGSIVVAPSGP